ncbi:retrograde transporter [Malassezia pachydermatis]|uniref:Clathrin-coated vesicle protein n=1 Tax=Malassezia pachydermatis TaxID=77020 RepID=A0A0M9VMW6_9BASI|nr:clathrin-coated vesicle protein [Malassezia pachydermatis]KOS12712.1 clathrin-coated vesicle protein [Malassezia pachydermatis]
MSDTERAGTPDTPPAPSWSDAPADGVSSAATDAPSQDDASTLPTTEPRDTEGNAETWAVPEMKETTTKEPHSPASLLPPPSDLHEAVAQERVDVFLLPWLTQVEAHIAQGMYEESTAWVEIVLCLCGARRIPVQTAGAPAAAWSSIHVGRAARRQLGRCLVALYRTSAPKPPLFEVLAALQDACATDLRADSLAAHVTALHVSYLLLTSFPDQVGSVVAWVPLLLRHVRATQNPVLARAQALETLQACLSYGVGAYAPATLKEVHKTLRTQLADAAGPVIRGCAKCLVTLIHVDTHLAAKSELEAMLTHCAKLMHTCDIESRRSLAELGAALLAQSTTSAPAAEGKAPTTQPVYALEQQCVLLQSHLARATNWPARAGVLLMYEALVRQYDEAWLEHQYTTLHTHVIQVVAERVGAILAPTEASYLHQAVLRLLLSWTAYLSEPAQVRVLAWLSSEVLAAWPAATPTAQPPSDLALAMTLQVSSTLLTQLGYLTTSLHEAVYEPTMRLLTHPSWRVQVQAAWWVRMACHTQPTMLAPTYAHLLQAMRRDMSALTSTQPDHGVSLRARLQGHSAALAGLAPVAAQHALYMRQDDVDSVFTLATDLLTQGSQAALLDATAAIAAAWTLVGALMALGPTFVKAHMTTLLPLWRNALSERAWPTTWDDEAWPFLTTVREAALSSLQTFFLHDGHRLLTPETARRLVAMLSHGLSFLDAWASVERRGAPEASVSALARVRMPLVRARLLRCCTHLAAQPALEALAPRLLAMAIDTLARSDKYASSATQAAIQSQAGATSSPWDVHDGLAYGVTSLLQGEHAALHAWAPSLPPPTYIAPLAPSMHETLAYDLEGVLRVPVLGGLEHDIVPLMLTAAIPSSSTSRAIQTPRPVPPITAEIDASAGVFAALMPYQSREVQIGTAEFLLAGVRRPALEKQPGRRLAVLTNSVIAWLGAVRTAARGARRASGFANDRVNTALQQLLQLALLHGDSRLRASTAELDGYVALLAGSASLTQQVQTLIEHVMDHRHADARAACALALGEVYARVGGLHASPLTKTVSSLLLSLASDPHPAVHTAALTALAQVIEAASVAYEPYVKSTLGLLATLGAVATHEPHGGSTGSANLRVQFRAYPAMAQVLSALIGVLGPDLQEVPATRHLLYAQLLALAREDATPTMLEALQALQRLGLVVPSLLTTSQWSDVLQSALTHPQRPLIQAAAQAYRQMAQRTPTWLAQHGGPALLTQLLRYFDQDPSLTSIPSLLRTWLQETASEKPCVWMDISCVAFLTPEALHTSQQLDRAVGESADEAAAVLATSHTDTAPTRTCHGWRTQAFVLECMHHIGHAVQGHAQHMGASANARDPQSLSRRVNEMVKAACSASTSDVPAVRIQGLHVLRDIMEWFATTRDPEFAEAPLLEQYAAPLAAALAPAWGAESTPDVLATAISVSAVFVAVGVDPSPNNRIVRLLTSALEILPRTEVTKLGDVLVTPNAAAYLKMAILRAWARLALTRSCEAMVAPHLDTVARAWVGALSTYAVLRADQHAMAADASAIVPPMPPDSALAPLIQAHMLDYFAQTWPTLLHALTDLFQTHADVVDAILREGRDASLSFMALYGLAFETLCDELERPSTPEHSMARLVLRSLQVLVDAKYSGAFLLQAAQFDELLRVCQRALQGDVPAIQTEVLQVLRSLVRSMRERLLEEDDGLVHDTKFATTKLGQLMRMLLVYTERLPSARMPRTERATLLTTAWQGLVDMVEVCGASLQVELCSVLLHTMATYAKREDDAAFLLSHALPVLRDIGTRVTIAAHVSPKQVHRSMQGFLTAMIEMADALRARSGDMVSRRSANALIATSLLLTSLDARVPISSDVLEQFAYLLSHRLDTDHDAPIALQCLRTIAKAAASDPPRKSLHWCLGACLPSWCAYAARHASTPTLAAPAVQALLSLVHVLTPSHALCISLPMVAALVTAASSTSSPSDLGMAAVFADLVHVAREHPAAFREATAALPSASRTALHDALRTAMGASAAPVRAKTEATISLRTFGAP